jgi:PAT family beta-lactamase induction signal transducer AmpG
MSMHENSEQTIPTQEKSHYPDTSPWRYVPSLYFAQGVPYVLVNSLSTAMYKSLGMSNEFIGITSFLTLPWSLKFLWSPLLDKYSTKRYWVLLFQGLLALAFVAVAGGIQTPWVIPITLIVFGLSAFLSASHDITMDGYYMNVLTPDKQALFTGIRSTFYRVATILAGGILVTAAGIIGARTGSMHIAWSVAFLIAAVVFGGLWVYHRTVLPVAHYDRPAAQVGTGLQAYQEAFRTYFLQPKIGIVIAFILFFRFGEGMLVKMVQPFLLDPLAKGGMGFSVTEVGVMYGTFGVMALVIGGIMSGMIVQKFGLKKVFLWLTITMHVPNILFVYLAMVQPRGEMSVMLPLTSAPAVLYPIAQICIIAEQFAYGLGFTAFMVFLLYTSKGEFKTSHYAISTGIMALGMMLSGSTSGYVQAMFGYTGLFVACVVAAVPGTLLLFVIPYSEDQ